MALAIRFLALPVELRLRVYDFLYVFPGATRPIRHGPDAGRAALYDRDAEPSLAGGIGLLRVSKRIHAEASRTLYSENYFHLCAVDNASINSWLIGIGATNRMLLRTVMLDYYSGVKITADFGSVQDMMSAAMQWEPYINPFFEPLCAMLTQNENLAVDQIIVGLSLLRDNRKFAVLELNLPGHNAGDLEGDVKALNNERGFYFRRGVFEPHKSIRNALRGLRCIRLLDVNFVTDLEALEAVAQEIGVTELRAKVTTASPDGPIDRVMAEANGWIWEAYSEKSLVDSYMKLL